MNAALIVAAGQGLRVGGPIPKQFLKLDGLPILSHTLRTFDMSRLFEAIVLVVPESEFEFCQHEVIAPVSPRTPIKLTAGGDIRQESVYNGLKALSHTKGIVAIHDGVRPFVTCDQIRNCMQEAKRHKACILGIPATDTLKRVSEEGTIQSTLDRSNTWIAQTPQVFQFELILRAHEAAAKTGHTVTDDAMLVEDIGQPVRIIHGSRNNIKITTPEDLAMAEALFQLLKRKDAPPNLSDFRPY